MSTTNLAEGKPRRVWFFPALVIGLLTMQVGLCVAGWMAAHSDRSAIVESDYYNKALHWDDAEALRRSSAALGWTSEINVLPGVDAIGQRKLTLTLLGRDKQPLTGATVKLVAFHHADPAAFAELNLTAEAPGVYAAAAPVRKSGLWEFRLTAQHGKDTYIATVQRNVDLATP